MEIIERASSVSQRNLMGYAYACATGKAKNCPPSIKKVAKSFMKGGKKRGIKSLKDFAKTKHKGLPIYKESIIKKFKDFDMENNNDVISFLYSLNNSELNGHVNDFLSVSKRHKYEYIEDILSEVSGIVDDKTYSWIESELKNM